MPAMPAATAPTSAPTDDAWSILRRNEQHLNQLSAQIQAGFEDLQRRQEASRQLTRETFEVTTLSSGACHLTVVRVITDLSTGLLALQRWEMLREDSRR
jgi:hypothetical protein